MTRGRPVLVAFPFDDLSSTKVRPALCLTDPIGPRRHLVLAFVSSQAGAQQLDSDLRVDPGHADFAATGLRVQSTIRLHRLLTVSQAVIRRDLGELSPVLLDEVASRLRKLFLL